MNNRPGWKTLALSALLFSNLGPTGCASSPTVQDPAPKAPADCQAVATDLVAWLSETDLVPARDLITADISNEKLMAAAAALSVLGEFKGLTVSKTASGPPTAGSPSWLLTTIAIFGKGQKTIAFALVRDNAGVYKVSALTIIE